MPAGASCRCAATMVTSSPTERVERLELTVQRLEGLPGEVAGLRRDVTSLGDRMAGAETQILQLRTEMRADFSAVRAPHRADQDDRRARHCEAAARRLEYLQGQAVGRPTPTAMRPGTTKSSTRLRRRSDAESPVVGANERTTRGP